MTAALAPIRRPANRPSWVGAFVMLAVLALVGCTSTGAPRSGSTSSGSAQAGWNPFRRSTPRVPAEPGLSSRGDNGGSYRDDRGNRGSESRNSDPFLPASGTEELQPPTKTPPPAKDPASTYLPVRPVGEQRFSNTASAEDGSRIALVAAKEDAAYATFARFANDPEAILSPIGSPRRYRYIVVSESGSSRDNLNKLDREHRERFGLDRCGHHFVIGPASRVGEPVLQATPRWTEQLPGTALGGDIDARYAADGLSVCLLGDFEQRAPSTEQLDASRELIRWLMHRYQIPAYRVMTRTEASSSTQPAYRNPGASFRLEQIL